jgi:hypothetical protein
MKEPTRDPGMEASARPAGSGGAELLENVTQRLFNYCRSHDWAGHDPYDALNSRVLQSLPIKRSRLIRLALTQFMKRSPIDLRPALRVPETQNPKALGLFLSALIKLSRRGFLADDNLISLLVDRLDALRSSGLPYDCWGYSFPWQSREVLVPRGYPNIVCTVFVGKALVEAYLSTGLTRCLEMSRNAAEYVLNDLYWTEGPTSAGFSYPIPGVRWHIYNADLLGAVLLCRVYRLTGDRKFLEPALRVARSVARRQREDGAWVYGDLPEQQWIDNFHTGYNLSALAELRAYGEAGEFTAPLSRGFDFYLRSFFEDDNRPKYYHDRVYPVDIHCLAQSIITLIDLRDIDGSAIRRASRLFRWALGHMWSPKGYFYYRVHPLYKNRISYMRWSQAWMLLALSALLEVTPGVLPQAGDPRTSRTRARVDRAG